MSTPLYILAAGTKMSKNISTFTNQRVKYTANMGMLCIGVKIPLSGIIGIPFTTYIVQNKVQF